MLFCYQRGEDLDTLGFRPYLHLVWPRRVSLEFFRSYTNLSVSVYGHILNRLLSCFAELPLLVLPRS